MHVKILTFIHQVYILCRMPMREKYMLLNGRLLIEFWLLVVLIGK